MIDDDGQQLGIMPPPQALALAKSKGLDLVEISPTAMPPVCRIMDFGKFQYEQQKKARSAKKHQKVILVKEIKFRPKVDEHDYQFKKKHIERFIAEGDKVKATIFFRGRELAHPEIGRRILQRLVGELADLAVAETMPRMEGNTMHTILMQKGTAKKAPAGVSAADYARTTLGRFANPRLGHRCAQIATDSSQKLPQRIDRNQVGVSQRRIVHRHRTTDDRVARRRRRLARRAAGPAGLPAARAPEQRCLCRAGGGGCPAG